MLGIFKPTWMVESIYNITPAELNHFGIKMVLTDLDNTLIAWNNPEATEETIEWMAWMKEEGIEVVIISNNSDSRVRNVAKILETNFISNALKPTRHGFKKVFSKKNYAKDEILMVGDQIMTDIVGANFSGLQSVLVKPIMDSDAWNTKVNRFLELRIMKYVLKNNPNLKWSRSLNEPRE